MIIKFYRHTFFIVFAFLFFFYGIESTKAQMLKSIVYDFDGLDIGATDLPEGDYQSGDMQASIAASPLPPNDMVGDRCLKLNLNWAAGAGAFGRGISRFIEFDPGTDQLNFFFYNPGSNGQNAELEITLTDDDDQSDNFNAANDDIWKRNLTLAASFGWQLHSIPLSQFTDANAGGDGAMNMTFTGNKGMLLSADFKFLRPQGAANATFYLDMISFSEGPLPHGADVLSLPPRNPADYCHLGAFTNEAPGQYHLTPSKFEALFPQTNGKKIRYVNTFLHWALDATTTPTLMPGSAAQTLLNNGYTPILTWEPMFAGYARLDPNQPRLQNILNGQYDGYIDAFADEIKKLSDTIIIRFMHEFEGDWYPWSIIENGKDPAKYIATFRKVVDRFRARGATKVKWMWCVNSDYAPYAHYNFIKNAYPGDEYVDIVATDIYNNHFPVDLPWWRSFRWQTTESYYYLTKYFGHKPLYICEVGCRERFESENTASESKGAWFERMDKELQTNFRKVRALVFFSAKPDQNWIVNSSPYAIESLINNVWNDDYYFRSAPAPPIAGGETEEFKDLFVYPNPSDGKVVMGYVSNEINDIYTIRVMNSQGKVMYYQKNERRSSSFSIQLDLTSWPRGMYYIELKTEITGEGKKENRQTKKLAVI